MTYLSEDATFLAGGFLLLAGAYLIALKVTQQGKYLVRAGVALGLALVVVVIEWLWVTDNERIEQVVYDMRRAVLSSDVEGVLTHLAQNVQFTQEGMALAEETTRALIRANLRDTRFDFVRISDLEISVGQQSRRGRADFRVFTKGSLNTSPGMVNAGTALTAWSLGFQETEPGVWKVNRISPISIPRGALVFPGELRPPDRFRVGFNDGIGMPRAGATMFPVPRRSGAGTRKLADRASNPSETD
jgi:hypothetical protein